MTTNDLGILDVKAFKLKSEKTGKNEYGAFDVFRNILNDFLTNTIDISALAPTIELLYNAFQMNSIDKSLTNFSDLAYSTWLINDTHTWMCFFIDELTAINTNFFRIMSQIRIAMQDFVMFLSCKSYSGVYFQARKLIEGLAWLNWVSIHNQSPSGLMQDKVETTTITGFIKEYSPKYENFYKTFSNNLHYWKTDGQRVMGINFIFEQRNLLTNENSVLSFEFHHVVKKFIGRIMFDIFNKVCYIYSKHVNLKIIQFAHTLFSDFNDFSITKKKLVDMYIDDGSNDINNPDVGQLLTFNGENDETRNLYRDSVKGTLSPAEAMDLAWISVMQPIIDENLNDDDRRKYMLQHFGYTTLLYVLHSLREKKAWVYDVHHTVIDFLYILRKLKKYKFEMFARIYYVIQKELDFEYKDEEFMCLINSHRHINPNELITHYSFDSGRTIGDKQITNEFSVLHKFISHFTTWMIEKYDLTKIEDLPNFK